MKAMSIEKFASFLALAVLVLGFAAMWSAQKSIAAAPVSIDVKESEKNNVQDNSEVQGLRMKLIIHRPGHAGYQDIRS